MKNIYEILKAIGIEIPEDKKAEFDKAVTENYKTVSEAEKLRTARDNYKDELCGIQEIPKKTINKRIDLSVISFIIVL